MKLNIFENLLLTFNILLLIFQLMLMGSIPSFFNFSILNLFVPIVVLVNLLLFCYWVIKIKWPFLLFMGAFLIGYGEWNLLYQFPNNSIRKSSATISVMSYNVRLFNKYNWIKGVDVSLEMSLPNRAGILTPADGLDEGEKVTMLVMPVMLNN